MILNNFLDKYPDCPLCGGEVEEDEHYEGMYSTYRFDCVKCKEYTIYAEDRYNKDECYIVDIIFVSNKSFTHNSCNDFSIIIEFNENRNILRIFNESKMEFDRFEINVFSWLVPREQFLEKLKKLYILND